MTLNEYIQGLQIVHAVLLKMILPYPIIVLMVLFGLYEKLGEIKERKGAL